MADRAIDSALYRLLRGRSGCKIRTHFRNNCPVRNSNRRFAILEAPSVLGLFPKGVERLPDALLGAGLAEQLSATRGVTVRRSS